MLHKLSVNNLHHQNANDTDRGHITTILEDDDRKHSLADGPTPSFTDTARFMLDEYDISKGLTSSDSMSSQWNLPRVRTTRSTAENAVQVAIAGDRRKSLPDLGSRKFPRPRSAVRKNAAGLSRLDSQVWLAGSLVCFLADSVVSR